MSSQKRTKSAGIPRGVMAFSGVMALVTALETHWLGQFRLSRPGVLKRGKQPPDLTVTTLMDGKLVDKHITDL